MTTLFEAEIRHSKEVLKSFAKLYAAKNRKHLSFRFAMVALILFTLPHAMHAPKEGFIVCYSFGIIMAFIGIARSQIIYLNLKLRDTYYKNNTSIHISFNKSSFEVYDQETMFYNYKNINNLYFDKQTFYIHMDDENLFVIPKNSIIKGSVDDFYDFLQKTTHKEMQAVNLNMKEKLLKLKSDMKHAENIHDQKISNQKK